jgi:hypothetical protein
MNKGSPDPLNAASRAQSAILDEIRNDLELIARLGITPPELEALSKCVLLGTLTCKQDMLFILRQIREATGSAIDHSNLSVPALAEGFSEEDTVPDIRQVRGLMRPVIAPGPLEGDASGRMVGKILFWASVALIGLVCGGVILMSRWSGSPVATTSSAAAAAPQSGAWYSSIDHFGVLLAWEALFLVVILAVTYIRQQRDSRRFKVKPGGGFFR